MISNAPIQTAQLDAGGLPTFAWTGWYMQVCSALGSFNQNGAIPNNTALYLLAPGNQWSGSRVYQDATNNFTIDRNTRSSASGSDAWVNVLKASASGTLSLAGPSLGFDAGSIAQARLVSGNSPAVILRNDGSTFYVLLTANGNPAGSWNSLRPLQINTANGSITLDQTGGGVAFSSPAAISFGNNWQGWTPTITSSGSMTVSGVSIASAEFVRVGPFCHVEFSLAFTTGGPPSSLVYLKLPLNFAGPVSCGVAVSGYNTNGGGTWQSMQAFLNSGSNLLTIFAGGNSSTNFAAGSSTVCGTFSYRCA